MNIEIDAQAINLFRVNDFEWQEHGPIGFRPVGFTDEMIAENYRSGIYVVVDLPYLQDSGLAATDSDSVPLSALDHALET
jgi:hypothetical protein